MKFLNTTWLKLQTIVNNIRTLNHVCLMQNSYALAPVKTPVKSAASHPSIMMQQMATGSNRGNGLKKY